MNENDECCEDLNQCIDGVPMLGISAINICPANGFCTNTCESYTCECNDGYHMDEGECVESVVTTTAEPSTISGSGDTTTVENPTTASSSTNAPSSVYEDPHFHITGISTTQPDICFDYDGVPGTDITLLAEDSGTKVIGSLFKPHVNISEVYFDSVEIRTPQNIGLTVSARGWNIHHVFNPRHLVDPVFVESTSNVVYKDLVISGIKRQNHGFSLIGRINGTFTFEIQSNERHSNVNFRILDQKDISPNTSGIIGQLIRPNAYEVLPTESPNEGFLIYNNMMVKVHFQRHAWNKRCWFIQRGDAKMLFEK